MAKYRYVGPGPIEVLSGGEVTRPGDERDFDEEPTWGPWELLDEPETAPPAPTPTLPPPPSLSTLTTPPAGTEGM